jgi:hypothetical protein
MDSEYFGVYSNIVKYIIPKCLFTALKIPDVVRGLASII